MPSNVRDSIGCLTTCDDDYVDDLFSFGVVVCQHLLQNHNISMLAVFVASSFTGVNNLKLCQIF